MHEEVEQKIIIIAGPNGAGKTTFAKEFLPTEGYCTNFINADLIAAGLAPFDPERAAFRAGRLMLEEIYRNVRKRENFAFETTLSGRGYAGYIPNWQAIGYIVKLIFLRVHSPEIAVARVQQRVREGGHNIPEQVIRRRFSSGQHNFEKLYKPLVDEWTLYDNSGSRPVLIKKMSEIMNKKTMDSDQRLNNRDPDLAGVEAALKRAVLKAREKAQAVGRGVIIWKDGRIVEELPDGSITEYKFDKE